MLCRISWRFGYSQNLCSRKHDSQGGKVPQQFCLARWLFRRTLILCIVWRQNKPPICHQDHEHFSDLALHTTITRTRQVEEYNETGWYENIPKKSSKSARHNFSTKKDKIETKDKVQHSHQQSHELCRTHFGQSVNPSVSEWSNCLDHLNRKWSVRVDYVENNDARNQNLRFK